MYVQCTSTNQCRHIIFNRKRTESYLVYDYQLTRYILYIIYSLYVSYNSKFIFIDFKHAHLMMLLNFMVTSKGQS